MASIDQIRASDGSGNAQVATVQSSRSPGSSTIIVDTVDGINDTFMGSMGTPHTFTDPITSETITVISEATAVDFSGHVDGSNLEIDDIAPGYTDAGSDIGDIIIIRPTTQYADNIADVLEVSHADDGSIRATSPKIITGINDTNGNELLKVTPTASAVNELTLANAATGAGPTVSATGGDSNIDINFAPKGTGKLKGVVNNLFNSYKFSVYRNAAWNTGTANQFNKVAFDTKTFDTGTNVDVVTNRRFVAPIDGFYQFEASVGNSGNADYVQVALYKNGSVAKRGSGFIAAAGAISFGCTVSGLLQLAAGDYVEVFYFDNGTNQTGLTGPQNTFFDGFLVSAS